MTQSMTGLLTVEPTLRHYCLWRGAPLLRHGAERAGIQLRTSDYFIEQALLLRLQLDRARSRFSSRRNSLV